MSLYDIYNSEMGKATSSNPKRKLSKCLPIGIDDKKKKSGLPKSVPYLRQLSEQSQNDSEEVDSEAMEDFKLSERVLKFEDIKNFLNFSILVDGMSMDSEFPDDIRKKYYKLCCSQNGFLHDRLVKGINSKLVVGIIFETVNIAYALKASNLTSTAQGEFSTWDKTLLGFEHLGMDVKFLRSRLHRIASLANEAESESYNRSYLEVRTERGSIENEMRNIEVKLAELKEACYGFGAYIDNMKSKAEIYELNFQGEVTAPL